MTALNYDANKLPLGKLSENTLRKGNLVLKEISEVLDDPTLAMSRYEGTSETVLSELSSRYYTIIPHVFGRNKPPVINSMPHLKREAELVQSLGEMEIAAEIISNVFLCSLLY
jgi:poly [ADP-ribose] polymerase